MIMNRQPIIEKKSIEKGFATPRNFKNSKEKGRGIDSPFIKKEKSISCGMTSFFTNLDDNLMSLNDVVIQH